MSASTLLIDNYDSFTYNLFDLLVAVDGGEPDVVVNDAPLSDADLRRYRRIVISPGPGRPDRPTDVGIGPRAIASGVPVLGVCLGHQEIVTELGGRVDRLPQPWHGLVDTIVHDGNGLFAGLPSRLEVVRYHSLTATVVPEDLRVTARGSDGTVMAVAHRSRPLWGVQFHPESICSAGGRDIMANFARLADATRAVTPAHQVIGAPESPPPDLAAADSPAPDPGSGPYRRPLRLLHRRIDRHVDPAVVWQTIYASQPSAFWLDRLHAAPGTRHSILGAADGPFGYTVSYRTDSGVTIHSPAGTTTTAGPLVEFLRGRLSALPDLDSDVEVPFDFRLGFVGVLGYGMGSEIGPPGYHGPTDTREQTDDDVDALLVHAGRAVVIDHDRGHCHLLALTDVTDTRDADRWLAATARTLESASTATDPAPSPTAISTPVPDGLSDLLRDHPADYRAMVERCLDHIRAGESYEICLTTSVSWTSEPDPVGIFLRLREAIPVPYAAVLRVDDRCIVSLSPERYLRVEASGAVESRPIKGTRPRDANPKVDARARDDLRSNRKDRAENLMIVDLVRNDLTRICRPGSVHVDGLFEVESFASVHQLVSTVRGTLRPRRDGLDAVAASFPPGSMTGAPKARTMTILDTVESGHRGLYSGAMGYVTRGGLLDLSVVIRTLISRDNRHSVGTGGAVTALSDPGDELREMLVKASTFRQAVPCERLPRGTADARD